MERNEICSLLNSMISFGKSGIISSLDVLVYFISFSLLIKQDDSIDMSCVR